MDLEGGDVGLVTWMLTRMELGEVRGRRKKWKSAEKWLAPVSANWHLDDLPP